MSRAKFVCQTSRGIFVELFWAFLRPAWVCEAVFGPVGAPLCRAGVFLSFSPGALWGPRRARGGCVGLRYWRQGGYMNASCRRHGAV
eukprot:6639464-Pyramimonas_sp.AAC.1